MRAAEGLVLPLAVTALLGAMSGEIQAQEAGLPRYLEDRGPGIETSLFGTYVRRREVLVYSFFEYAWDHNKEYNPAEFGFPLEQDFRGRSWSTAEQVFLAYGATDWLAIEFEMAHLSATLQKSPADPVLPRQISEKALTDFEAQVRARVRRETSRGPEVLVFGDATFPSNRSKLLVGDKDWDLRPGVIVAKGFSWGTLSGKIMGEWNREESHPILGELALEYLKRLSPSFRLFLAIEGGEGGAPDEADFIAGVQWQVIRGLLLKLDNAVGLQSKSADWVPQFGVMLQLPR
jgi:hypothetical protein